MNVASKYMQICNNYLNNFQMHPPSLSSRLVQYIVQTLTEISQYTEFVIYSNEYHDKCQSCNSTGISSLTSIT